MQCCVGDFGKISYPVAFSSVRSYYWSTFALHARKHKHPPHFLKFQKEVFFARGYAQAHCQPLCADTVPPCYGAAFCAKGLDTLVPAAPLVSGNDNALSLPSSQAPCSLSGVSARSLLNSFSVTSFSRGFAGVAAVSPLTYPSASSSNTAPGYFKVARASWSAFSSPFDAFTTVEERNTLTETVEHCCRPVGLWQQEPHYDGGGRDWSPDANKASWRATFWKGKQQAAHSWAVGYCDASVSERTRTNVDRRILTTVNANNYRLCYSGSNFAESGAFMQHIGWPSGCADNPTSFASSKWKCVLFCTSLDRSSSNGKVRQMMMTRFFLGQMLTRRTNPPGQCYTATRARLQLRTLSRHFLWRTKEAFFPTSATTTLCGAFVSFFLCDPLPRRVLYHGVILVTQPRLGEEGRQSGPRIPSRHQIHVQTTLEHRKFTDTLQGLRLEGIRKRPFPSQMLQLQGLVIAARLLCGGPQLHTFNCQREKRSKTFLRERDQPPWLCSLRRNNERVQIARTSSLFHRSTPRYYYITHLRHNHEWAVVHCLVGTEKSRQQSRRWLSTTTALDGESINLTHVVRCSFRRCRVEKKSHGQPFHCYCRSERCCQMHARTFWWGRSAAKVEISKEKDHSPPQNVGEPTRANAVPFTGAAANTETHGEQNVEKRAEKESDDVPQASLQDARLEMTFVSADGKTMFECTYRVSST